VFALDAGMFRPPTDSRVDDQTTRPTTKPTQDPKGDGTPCSGAKCFIEGMCRSNAGLCGAGIQFCNPKSVWEPNCPEETAANPVAPGPTTFSPTTSSWPSVVPTLSNVPSRTNSPSSFPEASNATTVPVSVFCNEAGSVGVTARETTQSTYISFTYALKSKNGAMPVDASLIAEFEQELQARLSCVYFDFPCLLCSGGNRKLFTELEIYDSSVVGISSSPKDQPTSTVCADTQLAQSSDYCSVVDGNFTAYFSASTQPDVMAQETSLMLEVVKSELDKNDWSMQVSYNNAPFPTSAQPQVFVGAEKENGNEQNGSKTGSGLSTGAIIGIVFGVLAFIAVVALSSILFIRHKRDEEEDKMFELQQQQQRAVPLEEGANGTSSFGSKADKRSESASDSDDSSYSSSSSEEGDGEDYDNFGSVGSGSQSLAISGDTFPTNAAHANDDESIDGSNADGRENENIQIDEFHPEEEVKESRNEMVNVPLPVGDGIQQLQQSTASDENPSIYEDSQGVNKYHHENDYHAGDYSAEDQQGYNSGNNSDGQHSGYERQQGEYPQNYHRDNGEYVINDDDDDAGSIQSADPPGRDYRDLPQQDDWENGVTAPQHQEMQTQNKESEFGGNEDWDNGVRAPQRQPMHNIQETEFGDKNWDNGAMAPPHQPMHDVQETGFGGDEDWENGAMAPPHQPVYNTATTESGFDDDWESGVMAPAHQPVYDAADPESTFAGDQNWIGDVVAPQHEPMYNATDAEERFHGNEDFENLSQQESAESMGSSGHGQQHVDDDQGSNPDSYYSNKSHGSVHSNHTSHSQELGSRHSNHSNDSPRSHHDKSQQDYVRYEDEENFDNTHVDGSQSSGNPGSLHHSQSDHSNRSFHSSHSQVYDRYPNNQEFDDYDQQHVAPPYDSEYMNYDQNMDAAAAPSGRTDGGLVRSVMPTDHSGDNMAEGNIVEANQYNHTTVHHENTRNRGRQQHEGRAINDGFDEESYHSFNPVPVSSNSHLEELDDLSHAGSAYTAVTEKASNGTSNETYGDEEESISNIFKSLSDIQTRLAGRNTPLPDGALTDNDLQDRNSARSHQGNGANAQSYQPVVEDVSVDGSQVSSLTSRALQNRRPRQGQWMEPLDESDDS